MRDLLRFWAEDENQMLTELSENRHIQCRCRALGANGSPKGDSFVHCALAV